MLKHQRFYKYRIRKRQTGLARIKLGKILKSGFFWSSFLFIVFILSLGYFLFLSDIFRIQNIKIEGNQRTKNEELFSAMEALLKKTRFEILDDNLLLVNAGEMKQSMLITFPRIENLSIIKKLPDGLEISIKERESIGIWCKQSQKLKIKSQNSTDEENFYESNNGEEIIPEEQCYYIDKNGVIFEEAPSASGSLILVIKSDLGQNIYPVRKDDGNFDSTALSNGVKLGDRVISDEIISFLLETKKAFSGFLDAGIKEFIIKSSVEVTLVTFEGWSIYFDISNDPQKNVRVLKRLLEESIKEKRASLEYIDLRVPSRVYYR